MLIIGHEDRFVVAANIISEIYLAFVIKLHLSLH